VEGTGDAGAVDAVVLPGVVGAGGLVDVVDAVDVGACDVGAGAVAVRAGVAGAGGLVDVVDAADAVVCDAGAGAVVVGAGAVDTGGLAGAVDAADVGACDVGAGDVADAADGVDGVEGVDAEGAADAGADASAALLAGDAFVADGVARGLTGAVAGRIVSTLAAGAKNCWYARNPPPTITTMIPTPITGERWAGRFFSFPLLAFDHSDSSAGLMSCSSSPAAHASFTAVGTRFSDGVNSRNSSSVSSL